MAKLGNFSNRKSRHFWDERQTLNSFSSKYRSIFSYAVFRNLVCLRSRKQCEVVEKKRLNWVEEEMWCMRIFQFYRCALKPDNIMCCAMCVYVCAIRKTEIIMKKNCKEFLSKRTCNAIVLALLRLYFLFNFRSSQIFAALEASIVVQPMSVCHQLWKTSCHFSSFLFLSLSSSHFSVSESFSGVVIISTQFRLLFVHSERALWTPQYNIKLVANQSKPNSQLWAMSNSSIQCTALGYRL